MAVASVNLVAVQMLKDGLVSICFKGKRDVGTDWVWGDSK